MKVELGGKSPTGKPKYRYAGTEKADSSPLTEKEVSKLVEECLHIAVREMRIQANDDSGGGRMKNLVWVVDKLAASPLINLSKAKAKSIDYVYRELDQKIFGKS